MSDVRCSDCLDEFQDGPRYAVIKEDTSRAYDDEERMLGAHLYQVLVCKVCVGWYNDPIEVA